MAGKLKALQQWCKVRCEGYRDVEITNMTSSWKSGLAFCAIIHRYRPDLIDYDSLSKENTFENSKLAFDVALECLGIPALLDPEDMVTMIVPDKLCIITYIAQYYNYFHNKPQEGGPGVKRAAIKRPSNASQKFDQQPEPKKSSLGPSISNKQMGGEELSSSTKRSTMEDQCHICHGKVYLLERHYSAGRLCHRKCQRESERHDTLRRSSQQSVKDSASKTSVKRMDVEVSSGDLKLATVAGKEAAWNDPKAVSTGATSSASLLKSLHTPAQYPVALTLSSMTSGVTSTAARSNVALFGITTPAVSRTTVSTPGINYNVTGTRTTSSAGISLISSSALVAVTRGNVSTSVLSANLTTTRSAVTTPALSSYAPVATSRSYAPGSGMQSNVTTTLSTASYAAVTSFSVVSPNVPIATTKSQSNINTSNDNLLKYGSNVQRNGSPNNGRPKSGISQAAAVTVPLPVPASRQAFFAEASTTKHLPFALTVAATTPSVSVAVTKSNNPQRPASAVVTGSPSMTPKSSKNTVGATVGASDLMVASVTMASIVNRPGKSVAVKTAGGTTSRDLGTSYVIKTTNVTSTTLVVKNVASKSSASSSGGSISVFTASTAGSSTKSALKTSTTTTSSAGSSTVPSFGLVFSLPSSSSGSSGSKQSSSAAISAITKPRYSTSAGTSSTPLLSPCPAATGPAKTLDVVVSVPTTRNTTPVPTARTTVGTNSTGFKSSPLPRGPVKMDVDVKGTSDHNVATANERAMLTGLMETLSSAADKKRQATDDRQTQGSPVDVSEILPPKPPRAAGNVSPANVSKLNIQSDANIKKDTGDVLPDWQLEAEKRNAARNGKYVDPEKYPRSAMSPKSRTSPLSPGSAGAPARPPPPTILSLNNAGGTNKSTLDDMKMDTKMDVIKSHEFIVPASRPTITINNNSRQAEIKPVPEKIGEKIPKRLPPQRPANAPVGVTQRVLYEKNSQGGKITYGSTESLESIVCKDGQKKPSPLGQKSNLVLRQDYGSVESLANTGGAKKKLIPASKFSFDNEDEIQSTASKIVPGFVFTMQEGAQLPIFDDTTTEVRQWLDANQPRIGAAGSDVPMRQVNAEERVAVTQIQDRLDVLDECLRKLENEGRVLEEDIRSRNDDAMDDEQDGSMVKWFLLVKQRYELVREETELIYKRQAQELEDIHTEVEFQYRCMMQKPDYLKTEEDKELEESLLTQLLETVSQRNSIIDCMEVDRKRYVEEDASINAMLEASGLVSPVSRSSSNGKDKKKDVKKKKSKEEGDGKPKSSLMRIFSLKIKSSNLQTSSSSSQLT